MGHMLYMTARVLMHRIRTGNMPSRQRHPNINHVGHGGKKRRGQAIFSVLKRAWVPIIVVVAVVFGTMGVIRLRGVFGSDELFSNADRTVEQIVSVNDKHVTYEVFGPSGTTGAVSYLNENAEPQKATFASLPWTHTLTTTLPVVVGHLVAQGDSDTLGCRISVNGVVKDEQSASGHDAQVFCLVKAA